MRPLIIDDTVRQDLKSLGEHARADEYSLDDLLDLMNGRIDPPGMDEKFFRLVPVGYKVVCTVENHPGCKMLHASISVNAENKLPHPVSIQAIIEELGFKGKLGSDDPNMTVHTNEPGCINILEKI